MTCYQQTYPHYPQEFIPMPVENGGEAWSAVERDIV